MLSFSRFSCLFLTLIATSVFGESITSCQSNKFCRSVKEFQGKQIYFPQCCKGAKIKGVPTPVDVCTAGCLFCLNIDGTCMPDPPGYQEMEFISNCKSAAFCKTQHEHFGVKFDPPPQSCCADFIFKGQKLQYPSCLKDCQLCKEFKGTCIEGGADTLDFWVSNLMALLLFIFSLVDGIFKI